MKTSLLKDMKKILTSRKYKTMQTVSLKLCNASKTMQTMSLKLDCHRLKNVVFICFN